MSENVFGVVQIGFQSGSFDAPGSSVAATFKYPISDQVNPDLDMGHAYPTLHRGRNVRNLGGNGYHGVRRAGFTLPSEVRYEDVMAILEMIYAGGVVPTGTNPYTWPYPFETGAPTVVPATLETGNIDLASAQADVVSCLVSSLTMGFGAITAGQASPWTLSAEVVGFDRVVEAVTADLTEVADPLETVQGHLTRLYEGTVATAFASLTELAGSLRSYTQTATRSLIPRAYGSSSDLPSKFGFTELSNTTYEMLVAVSSSAKTDLHDVWNTSGASLGERRIRVKAIGTGSKVFQIDARAGMFAVPWDDSDGERVYKVSGEFADDSTLDASHVVTVINGIDALPA